MCCKNLQQKISRDGIGRNARVCTFLFITLYYLLISAISPFILTNERAQAISYLHSLNNVHDEVAIKNPTDTINIGAYTTPLTLWSWISIGIFCVVCPPFLYFTTKEDDENCRQLQSNGSFQIFLFLFKNYLSYGGKDADHKSFTLEKSFLVSLYGMILKGWSVTPSKLSPRIVFIM